MQLEIMFAFAISFANVVFLAVRFCFRNKLAVTPRDYEEKLFEEHNSEERNTALKAMRENSDFVKGNF